MEKNRDIVMKMAYTKLLFVQILSSLTTYIGPLIDGIIISDFLGSDCMAAFGIVTPVNICVSVIAAIFNAGAQSVAGGYLGRSQTKSVNRLMTDVVLCAAAIGLALSVGIYAGAVPIAAFLGAPAANQALCAEYLHGYAIGVIPLVLMPSLIGFLQIDNSGRLAVTATGVMTVTDILCDLLAAFVLKIGMFGMGLATSISYYAAMVMILLHFMRKKGMLQFSAGKIILKDIGRVLISGLPSAVFLICDMIRVSVTNHIILSIADTEAVAAFSIQCTLRPLALSLTIGTSITTLLVCSVIIGEQNRHTLRKEIEYILKVGVGIAAAFTVLVLLISKYPLALLFCVGRTSEFTDLVALVLALNALSIPLCMVNSIFIYYYQSMHKVVLSNVLCIMDNAVFVLLAAKLLSGAIGLNGVWLSAVAAELLSLLMLFILAAVKNKHIPKNVHDYLFLPDSFGVPAEDRINITVSSPAEAIGISEKIVDFCAAHGIDRRRSMASGLCMEELSVIAIDNGSGKKNACVDVYVTCRDGEITVRLIDNCRPFNRLLLSGAIDENDPCANIGIRIVSKLAKDMHYSVVFGMNVFTLVI